MEAIKWHLISKEGGATDQKLDAFMRTPEAGHRRRRDKAAQPVDRGAPARPRAALLTPPPAAGRPTRMHVSASVAMLRSALLNVMIKAARKAARTLKRDFGEVENLQVSLKGPANFVTAADRKAEEILREELTTARPGYGFLGEEGGRHEGTDKTHTWVVDPLDGTSNFVHGIPHFAISIALEREGTRRRRADLQSRERRPVHRRARQGRLPQRQAPAGGGARGGSPMP